LSGLVDLLGQPFLRHALLAGIPVAALAGLVGSFMVLRGQVFAGDALSHVAFSGVVTALAFGVDPRLGLFAGTVAFGAVLGTLGGKGQPDDVVVGTVFAWVLGLGVLALSLYRSSGRSSADGSAGVGALFGSIFGLSLAQAQLAAVVAVVLIGALLAIARPLLFASLDQAVAAARGVPVRALGIGFLCLVGASVAEATEAVGALLILGLLAAPAGTAQRLTVRPYVAMGLASGLSTAALVVGLVVSDLAPRVPPSFAILAVATAAYAATFLPRPRPLQGRGRGRRGGQSRSGEATEARLGSAAA
jgi:zinc/manganese transport system permease protein